MLAVRLIAYSEKARDRLPLSRGEHSSHVSTPTMFIKEFGVYVMWLKSDSRLKLCPSFRLECPLRETP